MALQWMILTYVVAVEAVIALLLTIPSPKLVKSRLVSLVSLILQPSMFVVPFSAFQLLDIYWKNEHRLMCTGEICTAAERDRYEKSHGETVCTRIVPLVLPGICDVGSCVYIVLFGGSIPIYKAQRNVILCAAACLLYWCVYRICKYYKEIQSLEEVEKRYKDQ